MSPNKAPVVMGVDLANGEDYTAFMPVPHQGRGQLTDAVRRQVQALAPELGPEDFTVIHLRLLPYLFTLAMDHARLEPARVAPVERAIIADWRQRGWLTGGASDRVRLSPGFADLAYAVIKTAYLFAD